MITGMSNNRTIGSDDPGIALIFCSVLKDGIYSIALNGNNTGAHLVHLIIEKRETKICLFFIQVAFKMAACNFVVFLQDFIIRIHLLHIGKGRRIVMLSYEVTLVIKQIHTDRKRCILRHHISVGKQVHTVGKLCFHFFFVIVVPLKKLFHNCVMANDNGTVLNKLHLGIKLFICVLQVVLNILPRLLREEECEHHNQSNTQEQNRTSRGNHRQRADLRAESCLFFFNHRKSLHHPSEITTAYSVVILILTDCTVFGNMQKRFDLILSS